MTSKEDNAKILAAAANVDMWQLDVEHDTAKRHVMAHNAALQRISELEARQVPPGWQAVPSVEEMQARMAQWLAQNFFCGQDPATPNEICMGVYKKINQTCVSCVCHPDDRPKLAEEAVAAILAAAPKPGGDK